MRRRLLQALPLGAAGWIKPAAQSVMPPAHAASSPAVASSNASSKAAPAATATATTALMCQYLYELNAHRLQGRTARWPETTMTVSTVGVSGMEDEPRAAARWTGSTGIQYRYVPTGSG